MNDANTARRPLKDFHYTIIWRKIYSQTLSGEARSAKQIGLEN